VIHPLINRTGMGILDGSAAEMAEAIVACAGAGKDVTAIRHRRTIDKIERLVLSYSIN